MPGAADAAGQAAWRIRWYDLEIAKDRAAVRAAEPAIKSTEDALNRYAIKATEDPFRQMTVRQLDQFFSMRIYSEMHIQAAEQAQKAIANAEFLRRSVASGKSTPSDLAIAKAEAIKAEKIVEAADQARSARMSAASSEVLAVLKRFPDRTDRASNNRQGAGPAPVTAGAAANSGASDETETLHQKFVRFEAQATAFAVKVNEARESARLEGVAYIAVRDAVDAGQRSASDLAEETEVLKSAQQKMYDAMDESRVLLRQAIEVSDKMNQQRIPELNRRIVDTASRIEALEGQEKEAPTERQPGMADVLKQQRDYMAMLKADVARISSPRQAPPSPPRPILPVLPE